MVAALFHFMERQTYISKRDVSLHNLHFNAFLLQQVCIIDFQNEHEFPFPGIQRRNKQLFAFLCHGKTRGIQGTELFSTGYMKLLLFVCS